MRIMVVCLPLLIACGAESNDGARVHADGGETGDAANTGGALATGGATSTGGQSVATGGAPTGGASAAGGSVSTGGVAATGGATSTGGTLATGGAVNTGGVTATGGVAATGGATGFQPTPCTGDPDCYSQNSVCTWLGYCYPAGACATNADCDYWFPPDTATCDSLGQCRLCAENKLTCGGVSTCNLFRSATNCRWCGDVCSSGLCSVTGGVYACKP